MSIETPRRGTTAFLATAAILLSCTVAHAQGFAVTGGANVNPDQVFAGGRYEWPLISDVWFQPGADAGFGSELKLITLNFDATYRANLDRQPWMVYAGGGPALNFYRWDNGARDTRVGVNMLGGLRHSSGLFTEFRVALRDGPDFRFTVGYMLGASAQRRHAVRRSR